MAEQTEESFLDVIRATGFMPPYKQTELERHTIARLKVLVDILACKILIWDD